LHGENLKLSGYIRLRTFLQYALVQDFLQQTDFFYKEGPLTEIGSTN